MSNLPATRQAPGENRAMALVQGHSERLRAALPAHYSPEKLAQVMTVLCVKTPDILNCIPESVVTSLIQAATLDLDLSPGMNEGYLIPRWNGKIKAMECQFQPGFKGLEKLAVRTGAVLYVQPREVFGADEFEVWHEDDRTHFRHRPMFRGDRGRVTHYYAVAKMADGAPLIEVMTADDVGAIHQRTEGYKKAQAKGWEESGPWVTDYDAMARKTVIRKLCKSLPRVSGDPARVKAFEALNLAIEADNVQYEQAAIEPPPKPKNGSGFGHGMYASPEQSAEFERKLKGFLIQLNDPWVTAVLDVCGGDIPTQVKELNEYQADAHLLKWAVETGRLDPAIVPEEAKIRQRYRYTAIVYHRGDDDRRALGKELKAYANAHWHRQLDLLAKLRPELAGAINDRWGEPEDLAPEPTPPPAEDASQDDGDPEFDEAEVFGSDAGGEG